MEQDQPREAPVYKVVIDREDRYSIWPADRDNAPGWSDAGVTGPKQECLDYIKRVWTDPRPLSMRKAMDAAAKER